ELLTIVKSLREEDDAEHGQHEKTEAQVVLRGVRPQHWQRSQPGDHAHGKEHAQQIGDHQTADEIAPFRLRRRAGADAWPQAGTATCRMMAWSCITRSASSR